MEGTEAVFWLLIILISSYGIIRSIRKRHHAEEDAEEITEEPQYRRIDAEIVASNIQTNRNVAIYGKVNTSLNKLNTYKQRLDAIESVIIHTRSHNWLQGKEKHLTISLPVHAGEDECKYTFNLLEDPQIAELFMLIFTTEKERIRTQYVDEAAAMGNYANPDTVGAGYDMDKLKSVTKDVLDAYECR